jgi:ferric iron reductase protein FhuF
MGDGLTSAGGPAHAAAALENALQAACAGPWAAFAGRLVLQGPGLAAPAGTPSPLSALMRPAHRDRIGEDFVAAHGQTERTVIASIWSKWHFAILMPAYLIATLLLDWDLADALPHADFVLDAQGKTVALRLPAEQLRPRAGPPDFLALVDHLDACIALFGTRTGVTARVLANNAGNLFESFVQRVASVHGDRPEILARCDAAHALMARAQLDGQRPNPLHAPVVYLPQRDGPPLRQRRICCMRYLVPDCVFCTTCPSPLAARGARAC